MSWVSAEQRLLLFLDSSLARGYQLNRSGLVNVTVGKDAQVIHSSPDTSTSTFDITQGYLQYATGPLTVIGGNLLTGGRSVQALGASAPSRAQNHDRIERRGQGLRRFPER